MQPPSNVRRDSEGFEDIDAYYASSPHKRGASSPQKSTAGSSARKSVAGSSSRAQVLVPPPSSVSREKRNRPDLYHEIGELGRWAALCPRQAIHGGMLIIQCALRS